MTYVFILSLFVFSCGQRAGESPPAGQESNNLVGHTYILKKSNDILGFEQITKKMEFISTSSVRFNMSNQFGKVYDDETLTYRIEGNYVILVFPDKSESLEIINKGEGLKNSSNLTYSKQ